MTMSLFFLNFLVLAASGGAIYWFTWLLKNYCFSDDEKIQHIAERIIKVARGVIAVLMGVLSLQILFILLAPLFEQMNAAFNTAMSKLFELLDKIIPWAVLGGIGYFWWREKHPKVPPVSDRVITPDDIEKAEQEAQDIHSDVGELAYNASVDTAKVEQDLIICPDDPFGMETGRDKPYRMDEDMAIHQFILDTPTSPLTKEMENSIMQKLQRHITQRSKRYPHLCRSGYAPIVFDVRDAGGFVTIEIVLYAEKYMDKVNARHSTHFGRRLDYKPVASADDPLFKK